MVMTALAAVVAAVGLLTNNVAVIIGAMVIAPFLGPNVALALSTCLAEKELGNRALKTLVAGISLVLVLTVCFGFCCQLFNPQTSLLTSGEIAARTRPTLFDVVLAFASGCAGVWAYHYRDFLHPNWGDGRCGPVAAAYRCRSVAGCRRTAGGAAQGRGAVVTVTGVADGGDFLFCCSENYAVKRFRRFFDLSGAVCRRFFSVAFFFSSFVKAFPLFTGGVLQKERINLFNTFPLPS
jgi:hypothetical protein